MRGFIDTVGLEMETLPAHCNPAMAPNNQMNHWSCKIVKDDRYVVIFFSTSLNMRIWKTPENTELWPYLSGKKTGTVYDGPTPPHNSYEDQEVYEQCSEPEPPDLSEILDCLAKDIATVEFADGDFLKWAEKFKIDPTQELTKRTYNAVIQEAAKIKALLDAEEYQLFIQHSLPDISSNPPTLVSI